jgi:hypothetical protein
MGNELLRRRSIIGLEVGLGHIIDWDGILCNDFPHLFDFVLQFGNIVVVPLDGCFRFIIFLLQDLLLRCDSFQLLRKALGSRLQLLPPCYELLQLQLVLQQGVLLDFLLSLKLLPIFAKLL